MNPCTLQGHPHFRASRRLNSRFAVSPSARPAGRLYRSRPLLALSLLSCALLAGGLRTACAEDAPKTDKETGRQGDRETKSETPTTTKEDKGTGKREEGTGSKASSLIPHPSSLIARAQAAPAQNNPPQTSTPPQKPSEGQPAQTPAAPATPAATPPGTVMYSGLIDVYFGINARAPHSPGSGFAFGKAYTGLITPSGEKIGIDNVGRSFDVNDREPSFSLGEFNITRTEGKGFPLGVTATLTVGDTARLVHATEPGGTSSWQTLQQLYLTKTVHAGGRDIAIDGGIFVTPLGLEVIESTSNDNYSRSFGFQYGVPFYHAGFRATVPLSSKLQLLGAIVNGWNNIADDNDGKTAIAQLTWKPTSTLTGIFGFIGGSEGTGAYGPGLAPKNQAGINTYVYEAQGIFQATPALKLSGIIDYGTASGHTLMTFQTGGTASGTAQTHVSGTWLGFGGYARYQLNSKLALAGRIEQFEDNGGLRTGAVGYNRLREGTITLEYALLRGHLISRLEYRHDASNQNFFGAGFGAVRDQDTIYGSAAYKF